MRAEDFEAITKGVTNKWTKQRKAEERSAAAKVRRRHMFSARTNFTDVAHLILPDAYAHVSGKSGLHASQRQLYYAAREKFAELTGREIDWKYFANKILRRYLQRPETQSWKVTRDARGSLIEPHTDKRISLGTIQVDEYLSKSSNAQNLEDIGFDDDRRFPTCGPKDRYQAVLYIEKEGFGPLFEQVKLAERFDIAIMSCKGQSVIAARKLVDRFCDEGGIPLLVLHDFDKFGFSICQCLSGVSDAAEESDCIAYEFEHEIKVVDLGLRLEDVAKWNLKPERCRFTGDFDYGDDNITDAEKDYLRKGQRVELNAFTSSQFVEFVEGKLRWAGIKEKLVPDDDVLLEAYQRDHLIASLTKIIDEHREQAEDEADARKLPTKLREKLRKALKKNPAKSWDAALYEVVQREVEKRGSGGDA